jgi:uncharacterized protein YjbI with pentapeptide repeats
LTNANLQGANLRHVNLSHAIFQDTKM